MENPEEKTLLLATLVFPVCGSNVLLATKMRKIGAGHLNGWGGGKEPQDLSLEACASREFEEETGGATVEQGDLEKVGIAHFVNHKSDGTTFECVVHVYITSVWSGEIISTDEMKYPAWYDQRSIPFERLMLGDKEWLPRVLSGEKGIVRAEFGPHQQSLVGEVRFEPVDSFEEE